MLLCSICVVLLLFELTDDLEDLVKLLEGLTIIIMQKSYKLDEKCALKSTYLVIFESVAFFSALQLVYFLKS